MKYKTREFKQLQKVWNEKLKDNGFEDIEDQTRLIRGHPPLLKWDSFYFQARHAPVAFKCDQEYYSMTINFLNKFSFKSHLEKQAWAHHSDGFSIREITLLIVNSGIQISKSQVHRILSKLEQTMRKGSW